ncbi:MAG: molybdopterin-binding protein, partial [Acidimicrobiales bacterium]
MRAEIVAVGTELLLGDVVDTNSAWLARRLAQAGIDCHFHVKVGDNVDRIAGALRQALGRSDAVVVCGGLGPTPDDVTREAIAAVMGVALVADPAVLERVRARFAARGREMPPSNARQAEVPAGATVIEQRVGTAPGLICPVEGRVVYAVPGVPHELEEMVDRAVLADLASRGPVGRGVTIASRLLRTWGLSESALAERLAPRVEALGARAAAGLASTPTIAFLASGMEGIAVR